MPMIHFLFSLSLPLCFSWNINCVPKPSLLPCQEGSLTLTKFWKKEEEEEGCLRRRRRRGRKVFLFMSSSSFLRWTISGLTKWVINREKSELFYYALSKKELFNIFVSLLDPTKNMAVSTCPWEFVSCFIVLNVHSRWQLLLFFGYKGREEGAESIDRHSG